MRIPHAIMRLIVGGAQENREHDRHPMRPEFADAAAFRFAPGLTQLLTVGWVAIVAFVLLFRRDGWLMTVQLARLVGASLSVLTVGPHFAEFWRGRLVDAGCVAAILATGFAVGAMALKRWTPGKDLLTALFCLAAGLWILAVAILLIAAVSISGVPWAFLLAGCWVLPAPRRFFHRVESTSEKLDGWTRGVLACVIAVALVNLVCAWLPPFEYDELEYHLGTLAEYVKAGHIIALPHNFFSNVTQLTEMLYLLGLGMSSDGAAKLLHWSFGILTAVVIYGIGARFWGRRTGVMAAALFYCIPFVQDLGSTARIDLATTFFGALAFGALLLWADRKRVEDGSFGHWLWLSALATGAALATKWTAVPVVLLPAIVFVVVVTRSPRPAIAYLLLSSAWMVPWLVKNWLLMGNPVYPVLNGVFHNPHWSAAQAALLSRSAYGSLGWNDWKEFVGRAWQYSFPPSLDSEGHPAGGAISAMPLLLMSAPLVLLLRNVTPSSRRAGWLFVAVYTGWFFLTNRPWRFLFPAFPLAALEGAYAMHAMEKGRLARLAMRLAVGSVLAISLAEEATVALVDQQDYRQLPPRMNSVQYALGQVSREEFIRQMGGGLFEPIVWMNHHLPMSAKVLYIGEARVYYARHAVVWSTVFDQPPLETMLRQSPDARGLFDLMRRQHITHVYVNTIEYNRLRKSYGYMPDVDPKFLEGFLEKYARPVHVTGPCAVYELKSSL